MNNKIIKIVGVVATILGIGASVVTDWVSERKMEQMVDEKVKEALANTNKEEDEDEEKAESL